MSVHSTMLTCILVCVLTKESKAVLTLSQLRIVSSPVFRLEIFDIVGVATVELGGDAASRPTYFFDCKTNLNNGSGITWTRMSTDNTFEIESIPDGSAGKRLDAADIDYPDLDVYTCLDQYSGESVSLNITGFNPAIVAAEETVSVVQGLSVELEVYVSGYPLPTESGITWQRPDGTTITNSDSGVSFQGGGRRLILSNVQQAQASSYRCNVVISFSPYHGATTYIQLDVYVPITIVTQPAALTDVQEWSKVILNCSASGVPPPLISWEREDGAQLPVGAEITPSTVSTTITSQLVFNTVRYADRGRYRCVANNGQTNAAMSEYADVQVTPALRVINDTMQTVSDIYSVVNGARIRLECFGTGSLQWTSSAGSEIPSSNTGNIYQSYDQARDALALTIKSFSSDDTATYTCTSDLAVNAPITSSVLITNSNPAVVIWSLTSVQYVLSGTSTTLEARVFASPSDSATVRWYHRGTLIDDVNDNRYTASSEGDIHRLRVSSVSEAETGEYTIVVSLNGVTANDTILLAFPVSPSATVTPSSISVNEGEEVRLVCEVTGSRPLTVSWTLSDGSPPPVGVQENGNELVIAAANTSHPGTYVCSVSNLAGSSQDEAIVTVHYAPQVVITYSDMTLLPNEPLYLVRNDGDQGPTVVCSATGNPPPSIRWTQKNGRGLPSGIVQSTLPGSGEVELRWQRRIEFTDSGSYICQASNNIGTHTATLDILVENEPAIISIYPYNLEVTRDSQTFSYVVPLGYQGIALVCTADGWPAPEVEWQKDGQTLLNGSGPGVVSESDTFASTVSARLIWSREFNSSDVGSYECVVRKPNMLDTLDARVVQVKIASTMTVQAPPVTCSIDQTSVFFQIRVLGTDCTSWGGSLSSQIAADFRNIILSVVRTECGCQVDGSDLDVLGSPQCSNQKEGAAVFRGRIETTSQRRTELAYCALFSWQQKSPLIRINEQFLAVDSSCSLEASGSLDSEECVRPPTAPSSQLTTALSIAAVTVALILALVIVLITICVWQKRSRKRRFSSQTDATDVYSRAGQDPVALSGADAYSTLASSRQQAQRQDFIAQSVGPEMVDIDSTYYDTIPLRSRDNPTPSQLDWSGTYHATNTHTSSPSESVVASHGIPVGDNVAYGMGGILLNDNAAYEVNRIHSTLV